MNEQGMQFADPDWRPGAQVTAWSSHPENDLPVTAGRYTWQSEETGPSSSAFNSLHEQGYQGEKRMLVTPLVYGQASSRLGDIGVRPRARQPLWLWLVVLFFLILLVSTLPFDTISRFFSSPGSRALPMKFQTFNYSMVHISTLKIDNPTGSVHVYGTVSGTNGEFGVKSDKSGTNQIQFVPGPGGTLTVQVNTPLDGSQAVLNIILPQNIALNLSTTKGGDIEIDNMSGQVNLQSSGSINLISDNISGQSIISARQDIQVKKGSIHAIY